MIQVIVNGTAQRYEEPLALAALVERMSLAGKKIAVESSVVVYTARAMMHGKATTSGRWSSRTSPALRHGVATVIVTNSDWVCHNCDWDRLVSGLASIASY
jgi:hypothetical protein